MLKLKIARGTGRRWHQLYLLPTVDLGWDRPSPGAGLGWGISITIGLLTRSAWIEIWEDRR